MYPEYPEGAACTTASLTLSPTVITSPTITMAVRVAARRAALLIALSSNVATVLIMATKATKVRR